MTIALRTRHGIRIAILLGTASVVALASQSPIQVSGSNTPLCYCHCEHQAGAKQCTKMCDLPKYENRWWATSCHKKSRSVKAAAPRNSNSHSRKTNRTEQAHR